jgi:DNA (cytosine-5)-methyltransferase 1
MRVLSLFSGVGGFDMGLEAAGMTTVFQCELDKNCRQTLDHHWPDIPKWDDVSTLTGQYILDHCDGVDVVAWGSPCQDLSVAGKRAGLTGERSGLFHQGIRIIKELRELSNGKYPTWSIWENVAGALSSNNGADFGEVLYEMDEAGACFSEWSMLDAQYFGIPQRRRRVFVISCFDSSIASRCPEQILVVGESSGGDSSKGKPKGQGVADTVTESVGASSELGSGEPVANCISASLYHHGTVVNQDANNGHVVIQRDIVGSLQARDYKGVGNQYVMENKLVVQQTPPSAK